MSAMTSYEVVRRAIEMDGPDRLPLKLETPIPTESWGLLQSDVSYLHWNYIGTGNRDQRQTVDATAALIPELRARGFEFGRVCQNDE